MNRHQRRAAAARGRKIETPAQQLARVFSREMLVGAPPAVPGVSLSGGPMDGWVVAPDAPALRPDWYTTLPPTPDSFLARLTHRPASPPAGRYVLVPGSVPARATWQLIGQG